MQKIVKQNRANKKFRCFLRILNAFKIIKKCPIIPGKSLDNFLFWKNDFEIIFLNILNISKHLENCKKKFGRFLNIERFVNKLMII